MHHLCGNQLLYFSGLVARFGMPVGGYADVKRLKGKKDPDPIVLCYKCLVGVEFCDYSLLFLVLW